LKAPTTLSLGSAFLFYLFKPIVNYFLVFLRVVTLVIIFSGAVSIEPIFSTKARRSLHIVASFSNYSFN